jgi:hypothetical protein
MEDNPVSLRFTLETFRLAIEPEALDPALWRLGGH